MTTLPTFDKSIRYDRHSRDYRAELDGRLVGYFASYHTAEVALDEAAYDALIDGEGATASALDSGAADDPVNWTDRDPEAASWSTEPPPDDVPEEVPFGPLDDVPESHCCPSYASHDTQHCPEIRAALFAAEPDPPPWTDIDLGRELCRMRWLNFKAFIALLLSVPAEHLTIYARSYQAFIRSYRPDSDMTITQVLQVWTREMQRSQAVRLAA